MISSTAEVGLLTVVRTDSPGPDSKEENRMPQKETQGLGDYHGGEN